MKLMVGMNSIDDYIDFVQAGADEIFCGYIPDWWYEQKGMHEVVNRREVIYCQVQIGSLSDLKILKKMMDHYHVPITITLNALSYHEEDYMLLRRLIEECKSVGFNRFIIADLNFLRAIQDLEDLVIHISGEAGEMNPLVNAYYHLQNAKRIIFPRHITLKEMEENIGNLEYEAFILNEKCMYFGGYCTSCHCDDLHHMCLLPITSIKDQTSYKECLGNSGCGLCALFKMKQMKITHLKIVSRGNYRENTIQDLIAMKKALQLVEESTNEKDYIQQMKKTLFPDGCSENCYYVENFT